MEILPITNTAITMTTKIIHISFTTDNASTTTNQPKYDWEKTKSRLGL